MSKEQMNIEQTKGNVSKDYQLVLQYKRPTEHFLGWGTYVLENLLVRTYEGTTSKPLRVTPIEQTIIKLLDHRRGWSTDELCEVLGLEPEDRAERGFLQSFLDKLRGGSKQAIEGDDTYMLLTEKGRLFAQNGEVPERYRSEFSLLYWKEKPSLLLPKQIAEKVKGKCNNISQSVSARSGFSLSKEDGLRIIEEQAPKVHYPKNRYVLDIDSLSFLREFTGMSYELAVALLYDRETELVRLMLYDKEHYIVLDELSEYLSQDKNLVDSYIQKVGVDEEEKIQDLRDAYGGETIKQCLPDSSAEPDLAPEVDLSVKTLYDTLEFEEELGRIFTDETLKSIWLISPWIKKGAFSNHRCKQIETFLKQSSDSKVYLIYSMPEGERNVMMDDASNVLLNKLIVRYHGRLAIAQFPSFHYKEVITEGRDDNCAVYSGSFNILSFTGHQYAHNTIRAERMTRLLNQQDIDKEYLYFKDHFDQYKINIHDMVKGQRSNMKSSKRVREQSAKEGQPEIALRVIGSYDKRFSTPGEVRRITGARKSQRTDE